MISKNQRRTSPIGANGVDQPDLLIGIRDIGYLLYQHKKIAAAISASILAIAVTYSFLLPPIYRATIIAVPPSDTHASLLDGLTSESYDGDELFRSFRRQVRSKANQIAFLNEKTIDELIQTDPSSNSIRNTADFFQQNLIIDFDKNNQLSLHTHWTSAHVAEQLAARYFLFSERAATHYFLSDLFENIESQRAFLQNENMLIKKDVRNRRAEAISLLEEAKKIAARIGLVDLDTGSRSEPLYFRGVKALDAEIDALQVRTKNEIIYSSTLSKNLLLLEKLELANFDTPWLTNLRTAELEIDAQADLDHVSPIRYLIWLSGLGLGLLCSIFSVILLHYFGKHRIRENND